MSIATLLIGLLVGACYQSNVIPTSAECSNIEACTATLSFPPSAPQVSAQANETGETVTDQNESTPVGYKAHYGTTPGNYSGVADTKEKLIHTISNFKGGTYYFAVSAYNNSGGESALSPEASKTFPSCCRSANIVFKIGQ
jgi:hypothetical protein